MRMGLIAEDGFRACCFGGLATRLRPLTEKIPKALVEVARRQLFEHQLDFVSRESRVNAATDSAGRAGHNRCFSCQHKSLRVPLPDDHTEADEMDQNAGEKRCPARRPGRSASQACEPGQGAWDLGDRPPAGARGDGSGEWPTLAEGGPSEHLGRVG